MSVRFQADAGLNTEIGRGLRRREPTIDFRDAAGVIPDGQDAWQFIGRHLAGDWGELDEHDRRENELSVREGFRILSAYHLKDGTKIWIITEADRSATTILLPEEY